MALEWRRIITGTYLKKGIGGTVMGFPVCLDYPGPEEDMGSAAPRVPGPLARHGHHVAEVPQGAPRSEHDAGGARHRPHREVQDHLHTQLVGNIRTWS